MGAAAEFYGWSGPAAAGFKALCVGAVEAAALAGARVAAADWGDDLPTALGAAGAGAVLVVDAGSGDDAALATLLPVLVELAESWPVVVLFGAERLDWVAGALLGTAAQLLCDAPLTEQVAAIAVAGQAGRDGAGRDGAVGDGEAARLRRFSEEVARVAATLARLAADEGAGDVAERGPTYDAGPVAVDAAPVDAAAVRGAIRARRLRTNFFGSGLFEDPAWDMLLDLFAAELEGAAVSVSSLCIAAAVAPTTALRWVTRLTDAGLFDRRPDPQDRRRAFVTLSPRGSAAMRGYAAALARAGLGLG